MKLLQVFKDFKIIVKGKGFHGRCPQTFEVIPKTEPKQITKEDLENYVQDLAKRYPKKGFKLKKEGKYHIITQEATPKIPIYIDLENQTFYVPESYVKNKPKLVNYICMRTLGTLGITTTKYIRTKTPKKKGRKPKHLKLNKRRRKNKW